MKSSALQRKVTLPGVGIEIVSRQSPTFQSGPSSPQLLLTTYEPIKLHGMPPRVEPGSIGVLDSERGSRIDCGWAVRCLPYPFTPAVVNAANIKQTRREKYACLDNAVIM